MIRASFKAKTGCERMRKKKKNYRSDQFLPDP